MSWIPRELARLDDVITAMCTSHETEYTTLFVYKSVNGIYTRVYLCLVNCKLRFVVVIK